MHLDANSLPTLFSSWCDFSDNRMGKSWVESSLKVALEVESSMYRRKYRDSRCYSSNMRIQLDLVRMVFQLNLMRMVFRLNLMRMVFVLSPMIGVQSFQSFHHLFHFGNIEGIIIVKFFLKLSKTVFNTAFEFVYRFCIFPSKIAKLNVKKRISLNQGKCDDHLWLAFGPNFL